MKTYIKIELSGELCLSGELLSTSDRLVSVKVNEPSKELVKGLFERETTFSVMTDYKGVERAIITIEREKITDCQFEQK